MYLGDLGDLGVWGSGGVQEPRMGRLDRLGCENKIEQMLRGHVREFRPMTENDLWTYGPIELTHFYLVCSQHVSFMVQTFSSEGSRPTPCSTLHTINVMSWIVGFHVNFIWWFFLVDWKYLKMLNIVEPCSFPFWFWWFRLFWSCSSDSNEPSPPGHADISRSQVWYIHVNPSAAHLTWQLVAKSSRPFCFGVWIRNSGFATCSFLWQARDVMWQFGSDISWFQPSLCP